MLFDIWAVSNRPSPTNQVPSISGPPIAAFACEQKGALFGAYAYEVPLMPWMD